MTHADLDRLGRDFTEDDTDPVCLARNPWLDEYRDGCCRFPKSCSPHMFPARAEALNRCRRGEHEPRYGVCTICETPV